MPTKNDVIEFKKLIESVEEEVDEFLDEKLGDIELYLNESGFGEYDIIYETFDKIENSKSMILHNLQVLKVKLSKIIEKA
jgi:hypothetical protein